VAENPILKAACPLTTQLQKFGKSSNLSCMRLTFVSTLITCAAFLGVSACSTVSAIDQQVIYIPTKNGVVAERTSVGARSTSHKKVDPAAVKEVVMRLSERGWPCLHFAEATNSTYSRPYKPVPGDLVYSADAIDGDRRWFPRDSNELELYCILYGSGGSVSTAPDRQTGEFETRFADLMISEAGSARRRKAAVALQKLALQAKVYDENQPYLANIAIELTASSRLFSGEQGFSSCGQANCRLLHRTCGRQAPMRWPDQSNLQTFRLLCELRKGEFLKDLKAASL